MKSIQKNNLSTARSALEAELKQLKERMSLIRRAINALDELPETRTNGQAGAEKVRDQGKDEAPGSQQQVGLSVAVRRILKKHPGLATAEIAKRIDKRTTRLPTGNKSLSRTVAGAIYSMRKKTPPEITEVEAGSGRYKLA